MGTLHNRAYTCLLCCEHNRKIVNSIQLSLAFRAFYSHLSLFFLFFFRFFPNEICVYSFCARVGNVSISFTYIIHLLRMYLLFRQETWLFSPFFFCFFRSPRHMFINTHFCLTVTMFTTPSHVAIIN